MAYDSGSDTTLLFGGANVAGFPPSSFNGTWQWDGSNWAQLSPASSPTGRYFSRMCYDQARGRMVLYGGLRPTFFGANYLDDTWEWDGTNWTQITTANTPGSIISNPGLGEHGMAYDPIGAKVVVFGGDLFQGIAPSSFTLEYDGTNWSASSASGGPSPRSQVAMCSAPTLGGVLVFGGTNFNNPPGPNGEIVWNELWLYASSTSTWTNLTPASGPAPTARAGASLCFDFNTGAYVLHGGYEDAAGLIQPVSDTWIFDGTGWTDVTAVYGAPTAPRIRFECVQGPGGSRVLFGGAPTVFGAPYGDTWVEGGGASATSYGTGCTGSNGIPALVPANVPSLGSTYQLTATNLATASPFALVITGFSDTSSTVGPLPFPLSFLGLGAGCSLLTSTDSNSLIGASAGSGTYSLAIPASTAFAGTLLYHQAGSIDPAATGGFAVSNGIASRLQ
jgi:hypothetical protein